jgi:hypothetical protein
MIFARTVRGVYRSFLLIPIIRRRLYLFLIGVGLLVVLGSIVLDLVEQKKFDHLSPSEHLTLAKEACGFLRQPPSETCLLSELALRHLGAIPTTSKEGVESVALAEGIGKQTASDRANASTIAYDRYQKNIHGEAHDPVSCSKSTENNPIMSFDSKNWWLDDGRCADRLQKQKNYDSEIYSYISSTLRVDTDMDSYWLPDEERTCQTSPNAKGKVAMVTCNVDSSVHAHNIPVKFWGAVDRDVSSSWKCRRMKDLISDEFVCKALD